MPELAVLGDGHHKLDYAEWRYFFDQEWDELVGPVRAACQSYGCAVGSQGGTRTRRPANPCRASRHPLLVSHQSPVTIHQSPSPGHFFLDF